MIFNIKRNYGWYIVSPYIPYSSPIYIGHTFSVLLDNVFPNGYGHIRIRSSQDHIVNEIWAGPLTLLYATDCHLITELLLNDRSGKLAAIMSIERRHENNCSVDDESEE